MRLKTVKHPLCVCGILYLFLLNTSLQGLVLCFGNDGHRAIESEHKGACQAMRHAHDGFTDRPLHRLMVCDRKPDLSCNDVRFNLDRFISGSGSPSGKHTPTLIGRTLPLTGFIETGDPLPDRSVSRTQPPRIPPDFGIHSVLKC